MIRGMILTRHAAAVEQWRPLVDYYRAIVCSATSTDYWLQLMWSESQGDTHAVNGDSGAAGLFQHLPTYWPGRRASTVRWLSERGVRRRWMRRGSKGPHVGEANIAVAMWLYLVQGFGAWSGSRRFPPEAYGPDVWWHDRGYVRVRVSGPPQRWQAPGTFG